MKLFPQILTLRSIGWAARRKESFGILARSPESSMIDKVQMALDFRSSLLDMLIGCSFGKQGHTTMASNIAIQSIPLLNKPNLQHHTPPPTGQPLTTRFPHLSSRSSSSRCKHRIQARPYIFRNRRVPPMRPHTNHLPNLGLRDPTLSVNGEEESLNS